MLSKPAREWKAAAVGALPRGRVAAPLTGRLVVWMTLHPPANYGKRKWDIANREKCALDFLTEQRVWLDDSQIDTLVIVRGAPEDKGWLVIQVQEG